VVGAPHIGPWVTFYGMVQIWKLHRIPEKENRRVVSDQVPNPFGGVKLQGKTPNVPFRISSSSFSCYRRQPGRHLCLLPAFAEYFRFGIRRDIVCDGKCPECPRTFGMHSTFGNDLSVKIGHFFQKPIILHKQWTSGTGSLYILIIGDRCPCLTC